MSDPEPASDREAASDPVEAVYDELERVIIALREAGEYSSASALEPNAAKVVVLAAASYFEDRVKACLQSYVHDRSLNDVLVTNFVMAKAIDRQYHTFFNWDGANANQFFGLFGADFKKYASACLADDSELDESIRAFLSLGALRNSLVHRNFIVFPMDSTAEEIRDLYRRARLFVERIPSLLREFSSPEDDD